MEETSLFGVVSLVAVGGMALTALVMVSTPGPNMLYLVSRSISQGRAAGMVSLCGTATGFLCYLMMANLGLAVIFVVVPWLFIAFKAAGVVYLAYLAWQALRPNGKGVFETRHLEPDSPRRLFGMGLMTNLLNPKAAILYLTLIPQYIDPASGDTVAQGFVLGGVQIAVSFVVNAVLIMAAGSFASLLAARPRWAAWQRRVSGAMLGLVALLLAREVPHRARV